MKNIRLWWALLLLLGQFALGLFAGGMAHAADSKGTEHFFAFMPNYTDNPKLSLFITGEEDAQGTVQIPGLNFVQPFTVQANEVIRVDLPTTASTLPNNIKSRLGVKVISDREVTVYGLSKIQYSTDAFLSLPTDTLGLQYFVMSYNGAMPSEMVVVGVYDNTQVTIRPSKAAVGRPAGQAFTFTLNSNDTFLLQGSGGNDLTGSSIEASAPVGVLSGTKCANVPVGVTWCDHIVEMMPPVSTWGKSFLTVPLATRRRGDVFRVLASQANTVVKINGAAVATLNRGAYYETVLTARSQIEASEPVLVAQYSAGQSFDGVISDPFMMLVPPSEQFLSHYGFSTLGPEVGFANSFVNVVAPATDIGGILLDGAAVNPALFQPIGQSGFSGAQIQVGPGSHTIHGTVPFGIYVYGFGSYDSYGYPGGMAFDLINSRGDRFPPNVKLMSMGSTLNGVATDSEDLNANGTLDPDEDLNGNGLLDRRTEDLDGNQILDAGEDGNGDGVLDRDTGLFRIELAAGAKNLRLIVDGFVPGTLQASFQVVLIDPAGIGSGTLVISDGSGNKVEKPILLSTKPLLTKVRVLSTLSSQDIDLDSSSFLKTPDRVEIRDGKTLLEWRFDYIAVDQIENLDYEVVLRNPVPNEQRLVTQTLELFYTDVNGNEVRTELGEQKVSVLPSIFAITVATDRQTYTAHEAVLITAGVKNLSEYAATAPVRFLIQDASGIPVAELGTQAVADLAAAETRWIPGPAFDTGTLFQGDYTVQAQILDETGMPALIAVAPFAIVHDPATPDLAATLSPDKLIYAGWDHVRLDGSVTNTAANALLEPTVMTVTVNDPSGTVLYTGTAAVGELAPGGALPVGFGFALADAASGLYTVEVQVTRALDGTPLSEFRKTFTVVRTALQGLAGALAAAPAQVIVGTPVDCRETVENRSASGVEALALDSVLVDLDHAAVLATDRRTLDLAGGQTENRTRAVDTAPLPPGDYACLLRATLDGTTKDLASAAFRVLEPPVKLEVTRQSVTGRVLALVSCQGEEDHDGDHEEDDHHEGHNGGHEEDHHEDHGGGHDKDHGHGDDDDPEHDEDDDGHAGHPPACLDTRRALLERVLTELGLRHLVVSDADAFRRAFRSGVYDTYWLSGGRIKLKDPLARELREAVYRGEGLLLDGQHDERNKTLDAAGGFLYRGKLGTPDLPVAFTDAPFAAQTLLSRGRGLKLELAGGGAVAAFPAGTPAVVRHRYGSGRSLAFGFDLPASLAPDAAYPAWRSLVGAALADLQPAAPAAYLGGAYARERLTVRNLARAVTGLFRFRLPDGAALAEADPALAPEPDGGWLWRFDLPEADTRTLDLGLRLPASGGDYPVAAHLDTVLNGVTRPYGDYPWTYTVATAQADAAALRAALRAYQPPKRQDQQRRDRAVQALDQALELAAAGQWEKALEPLLDAGELVAALPAPEAPAWRTQLARLLREYAGQAYRMETAPPGS
jgi:hypothetical protein